MSTDLASPADAPGPVPPAPTFDDLGLIPELPRERIVKVGNAALAGASQALLSRRRRAELDALVQRVELVRLEAHPAFFEYFVQGCQFVPLERAP